KELKRYQELRKKGETDDSDELLNRAKLKEGELEAAAKAAQPVPAAPAKPAAAPDAGAKDAAGGAKPGGGSRRRGQKRMRTLSCCRSSCSVGRLRPKTRVKTRQLPAASSAASSRSPR